MGFVAFVVVCWMAYGVFKAFEAICEIGTGPKRIKHARPTPAPCWDWKAIGKFVAVSVVLMVGLTVALKLMIG